jgi:hypothetical protein
MLRENGTTINEADLLAAHNSGWSLTQDSTAATAQTLTKDAEEGKRHYITGVSCCISAADNSTNDITAVLKDGETAIWKGVIGAADKRGTAAGQSFPFPLECSMGAAVSVEVSAGPASCVTTANLVGFTLYGSFTNLSKRAFNS